MRVGIIPARGGSKRIPRKNLRVFCGKPIIQWTIETAQRSACFDRIVLSTDDPEIADFAKSLGVDVPFHRPLSLADDHTTTLQVMEHAVAWLCEHDRAVSAACCMYATAPLMRAEDIRKGLELLTSHGCDYAFSCTRFSFPVQRAIRITDNGRIEPAFPSEISKRSQDLPEFFHDAGQFYWGRADAFLEQRPIFSSGSVPVVIPTYRVQDIDTNEDWKRAEIVFRALEELKDE